MDIRICKMLKSHYAFVRDIYEQGIRGGISTFQDRTLEWEVFDKSHLNKCRFVAMDRNKICGWITLSPISIMEALSGVAEISIYVENSYKGMGIGKKMMMKLMETAKEDGIWSLQSMILPENERSIYLHKKCGFREVGYKEKIGKMPDGTWRDVILFEKRL